VIEVADNGTIAEINNVETLCQFMDAGLDGLPPWTASGRGLRILSHGIAFSHNVQWYGSSTYVERDAEGER
jgi:hypothetical protein